MVLQAHGMPVADGKARGIEEVDLQVPECLQQIRDSVYRITMVAIQRHDEIAGSGGKPAFVAAAVAARFFADHLCAERPRHVRSAISGGVVDYDDLVDEIRHVAQHALDALFFVEAGDDDRDGVAFVHYLRAMISAIAAKSSPIGNPQDSIAHPASSS